MPGEPAKQTRAFKRAPEGLRSRIGAVGANSVGAALNHPRLRSPQDCYQAL